MNRWTILTVFVLVFCLGAMVNTIWGRSIIDVIGFVLTLVIAYWIVGGCARRGEPLARRLFPRT